MVDDAFELIRPLPHEPVHHIAAIAGPQRAGIVRRDGGIELGGGGEAQFQIGERLAAPILVDRVREGLAISRAAVEIDSNGGQPVAGKDFRVPAEAPAIPETALRPAMDEISRRRAPGRPVRLDHLPPDGVAIRTLEAEPLHRDGIDLPEQIGVHRSQLPLVSAGQHAEQVVRGLDRILGIEHRAIGQRDGIADAAALREAGDGAVQRDHEGGMIQRVLRGHDHVAAVRRPCDGGDRAVPSIGDRLRRAAAQIAQHQHQPVALITGPRHGGIGQPAAIGGRRGHGVGRLIGVGQIGQGAAIGGGGINVRIGGARLHPARFAQRVEQRLSVRAPVHFLFAAKRIGRRIAGDIGVQRHAATRHRAVHHIEGEDAIIGARRGPAGPVAHEIFVIGAARLLGLIRQRLRRGAAEAGAVFRDRAPQGNAPVIGRKLEARHRRHHVAGLHRRRAGARHPPDLIAAGLVADEPERSVGGKSRRTFGGIGQIRDRHRHRFGLGQIEAVELRRAAVILDIGAGDLIDGGFAIRRYDRRAEALHRVQIDLGHGTGGGGGRRGGDQNRGGSGGVKQFVHGAHATAGHQQRQAGKSGGDAPISRFIVIGGLSARHPSAPAPRTRPGLASTAPKCRAHPAAHRQGGPREPSRQARRQQIGIDADLERGEQHHDLGRRHAQQMERLPRLGMDQHADQ